MKTFIAGTTGRSVAPGSRYARRHAGSIAYVNQPLIHASPVPPVKATRTGSSMVAVCGARIAVVYDGQEFSRSVGRKCRACAKAVAE